MKFGLRMAFSLVFLGVSAALLSSQEIVRSSERGTEPSSQDKLVAETSQSRKEKAEKQKLAKDLLQRAYGVSKDLSDSDRALVISRLAQSSVRAMPDQSKAWADEVFQITAGLSNDNLRGQYEMNALNAVIETDPDHALQLLLQMSPPGTTPDGNLMGDMRTIAATMLFQKYFQKKGDEGLANLQSTARQMGEAGIYPYMAMGSVIRSVGRKDQDKAQLLVTEALSYFSRLKKTDSSGQQMAMFLRTNRELISKPLLKDVLTQLITDALATKDNSSNMVTSISTNGNTATLSGASSLILYQLMPMIRDVDPDWAKKLEEQNNQLRGAAVAQANNPGGTNRVQMAVTVGGPGPNGRGNPMEEMKVNEVDELAQKDPAGALKLVNEINDPVMRAASGARLAGDLNASDPEQASKLVKNAKEAMAQTPEVPDKLRILAGLATAQSAMKDKAGLANTFDQAFTMGEDLYRKSVDKNPGAGLMQRPGIESLMRVVTAGVKSDPAIAVDRINKLGAPAMQAVLLISAAEALDPEMKTPDTGFRIMIRNS